jgi:RNA polymerase sigma-70 factor (ECF subfamily)
MLETEEPPLRVWTMTNWSEIVEHHETMVWRTAYRLLNNEADAADCFQRTFVSALELARKEPIRNWPALLKRLVTARALERLRQRGREDHRQTSLPASGSAVARAADPLQAAEASELAEHLRLALADLDPRQAQVFCLVCLEGFTYHEIAEQIGVTVNHVGVLLNRARTILRERLQVYGPTTAAESFGKEGQP